MSVTKKITLAGITMVVLTAITLFGVVLVQQSAMRKNLDDLVSSQSVSEAAEISKNVYVSCEGILAQTEQSLTRNLNFAKETLNHVGTVSIGTETVSWDAVNQLTREKKTVPLPKLLVGGKWLGQNDKTNTPSPVVDEVRDFTGVYVTIFQRMNEQGDMLRVCTSVLNTNGTRAIGTYIPSQNGDGSENPVIKTVLGGETYFGRAFVVNDWHVAAYQPIWDEGKTNVVGMLYVGVAMADISRGLRKSIPKMVVGKSGYVFVLGGKGEQRGQYIVSHDNARDGENIWDAKDAQGRLVIQSLVEKALKLGPGEVNSETYTWQNKGEAPRKKISVFTYFQPWDWIIAASVYEDDLSVYHAVTQKTLAGLEHWFLIALES